MATIYTAGAFAVAAGATGGTFAAGVTALGSGTLGFGAAAVAGAVGSIAGQVAGIALGVQDKFSWGAVAAGAIGAGIGASGALGSIAGGNPIGQAIAGNIINQGVGIITGAQKGFSWAGVAAAAIAAPITSSIGKSIKDSNFGGAGTAGYAIRGAAIGIATSTVNELTRVALVGGKLNWASVAIGGISGGIYGYGEGLRAKANILNQPVYGNTFDEDRKARAQMFGLGSNSTATDMPSVLRLSDDEVFSNAMARQDAEKRSLFDTSANQGGLAATNDLGVLQRGGLTSSFSTAQGEGVVYGREQYMKGIPRTAGAGDVKGQAEAVNGENAAKKVGSQTQTKLGQNSVGNDNPNYSLAQNFDSTLDALVSLDGKIVGANKLLSAQNIMQQQLRIKQIMSAATLVDAQAVIKGNTAKSAMAMAEFAAKYEGAARKLPYLSKALAVAEESKRFNMAQTPEEQARVVAVGSFNYIGDNFATTAGVTVGAQGGVIVGATIGSAVPIIGTAVGAVIGGAVGAVGGALLGHSVYDTQAAPRLRAILVGEKFRD